jgi:methionine aminopeptidase
MSKNIFCLDTLNKLGNSHREIMSQLKISMDSFATNKDIYNFINDFLCRNNLSKAFPIGISINHVIAHDSYHESNIKTLKQGDFIKIDIGLIESGNIIDSARTFVYKSDKPTSTLPLPLPLPLPNCITDCESICNSVEDYIRKQIETEGKISIQKISALTNALVVSKGYDTLDFLGGHTIEYGKVHGKHYILNKPVKLLPKSASMFIDTSAEIGHEEMFAIEIYIGEKKASGTMIKSTTIPVTHYQVNSDELEQIKLNKEEKDTIDKLILKTNNLAYEYSTHKEFNAKIIKSLIEKNAIIKHDALEFKSNSKEKIKYIQYEDCYLIRDGELINLSK